MADFSVELHLAIKTALNKLGFEAHISLKDKQRQAIANIVHFKRDCLVVLPTGYGKSLVYQCLPPVFDSMLKSKIKSAIVIVSPLNSLILDQVSKLKEKGMGATIWKADEPCGDTCSSENIQYIYAHPEVFVNKKIVQMLKKKEFQEKIQAVIIDEAHLVIDWKNFRPAYARLGVLASIFPKKPIVALTATATKKKQQQIIDSLGMINTVVVDQSPNRPNIFFSSSSRDSVGDEKLDDILLPLAQELSKKRMNFELTLIYGNLETIATCFSFFSRELGIKQYEPIDSPHIAANRMFTMYHAQYPEVERQRIVSDLISGKSKLRILFVTVAFGLGIDLPDIRRVIHIGVPSTIEEYLQEAGRAGRDGLPATAHVYFNSYDISKSRKHLSEDMRVYVQTHECKREKILSYFGFPTPPMSEHSCCDSCDLLLAKSTETESITSNESPKENRNTQTNTTTKLGKEEMARLLEELHQFRFSLPGHGRSVVGSISLITGISIELLDEIAENANAYCSVDDLAEKLPFFSYNHAHSIWQILKKYQSDVNH